MKITNPSQFEKLVEELGKNPSFANGFRSGTVPNNYKEQWENISTALNALGPPKRSSHGWQKVWRDFKFKVRKKFLAKISDSGGLKFKQPALSPLEESVVNLLHFEKQIKKESANQEVLCQDQNVDFEIVKIEEITDVDYLDWTDVQNTSESESRELPSTANFLHNANCTPLKRKKPHKTNTNSKLFKRKKTPKMKKTSNQHDLTMNSLSLVKRTLQEINEYLKELLEIEKNKLKLALEKNEREKEMHEVILNIKRTELSIKKKELQLYNRFL